MSRSSGQERAEQVTRRELLAGLAGGAAAAMGAGALAAPAFAAARESAAAAAPGAAAPATAAPAAPAQPPGLKGRIKQAGCPGVFGKTTFEQKCQICKDLGLHGVDLVDVKDWPTLKKYGLICTMGRGGGGIGKGFNRKENHDEIVASLRTAIEAAAEAGFPNIICFSGNRAGLADDAGIENCAEGLKKIAAFAEEKKINVCMELLNSKRNHKDYQCDRTAWGAEVCKRVGSPRVKLLYDIYHMQVQEGDVIATIREFFPYIGHFHTAGVPGRHEPDETQELYYPAIMRAIVDLKFEGYVAHEYGPTRDAVESLRKAIAICDV
ncbi:MAG: TIM barrel protein [Planctomycetes bacterium]|nr:TIM barrel protein [Planctomycetota bacterium]